MTAADGAARVEWLTVGGPAAAWERLGLVVVDGLVPLVGTGIRIDDTGAAGLTGWALSGVDGDVDAVDGVPTVVVDPSPPLFAQHPLGAIGLDHVVVVTDSLERTCDAVTAATGAALRRVREAGDMRQGFHRLGGLIVEVVERTGLPIGPAWLWGLVVDVDDLDAAVALLGPAVISPARPAVQPGRSIATVRADAGLGTAVALMSQAR